MILILIIIIIIGSFSIFYQACLFSCNVDVQFSHQCFGGHLDSLGIFGFPLLGTFTSRLSSILFT